MIECVYRIMPLWMLFSHDLTLYTLQHLDTIYVRLNGQYQFISISWYCFPLSIHIPSTQSYHRTECLNNLQYFSSEYWMQSYVILYRKVFVRLSICQCPEFVTHFKILNKRHFHPTKIYIQNSKSAKCSCDLYERETTHIRKI